MVPLSPGACHKPSILGDEGLHLSPSTEQLRREIFRLEGYPHKIPGGIFRTENKEPGLKYRTMELCVCVVVCVCVCVFFFSFILDIKFVGRTSRSHTGFLIHLPSAVRA